VKREIRPIHENRLSSGMSVHVKIGHDPVAISLLTVSYQLPQEKRLWSQLLIGVVKQTVYVSSDQGAASVSNCDAVCVDHRNNFENDFLAELTGHFVLR